jgi:hypothetical protein
MSAIPVDVWQRWSKPEYDLLRQAVLTFGGDTGTEAALEQFRDVSLLYQAGEGTSALQGVFCLTTKRFVFLPHFQLPHPQLVQSRFVSVKSLSSTRSDLTVTVTDESGGTANFEFPNTTALFIAFNLLRLLCESSRKDRATFCMVVSQITTQTSPYDSPFSSIEVELSPCGTSHEIAHSTPISPATVSTGIGASQFRAIFDYCNNLRIDIHIKLRLLVVVAGVSLVLQFIPFLPFLALASTMYSLWRAWTFEESGPQSEVSAVREFAVVSAFFNDWLGWRNHEKSMSLLRYSAAAWFLWMILPGPLYYGGSAIVYALAVVGPLCRRGVFRDIVAGFWFCT